MNVLNGNGRPQRKTLANQLDRLDNTIDALADGVNRAVADAVREAVASAVQQAVGLVLRELLSKPEVLRQLAGQVLPPVAAPVEPKSEQPSRVRIVLAWIGNKVGTAFCWIRTRLGSLCSTIIEKVKRIPARCRVLWGAVRERLRKVWVIRRPVLVSLLVGIAVGGSGYLAGPVLSSMALGLCSSAMSLFACLFGPLLRLWRSFRMQAACPTS